MKRKQAWKQAGTAAAVLALMATVRLLETTGRTGTQTAETGERSPTAIPAAAPKLVAESAATAEPIAPISPIGPIGPISPINPAGTVPDTVGGPSAGSGLAAAPNQAPSQAANRNEGVLYPAPQPVSARHALYEGAEELAREETPLPGGGWRRVRLLRTGFKYPLIEVEETVAMDPGTGEERVETVSEAVADHVMVKTAPGADEAAVAAALARHGMTIRRKMRAPGLYLAAVPQARLGAAQDALAALERERAVLQYAERDPIAHALDTVPNDPDFYLLWGLRNIGQMASSAQVSVAETGFYAATPMTYSPPPPPEGVAGLLYDCGYGGAAEDFPAEVAGNIALISRGGTDAGGNALTFPAKTANARAAGAAAAIVYNNVAGSFAGTLGGPGDWIPVVSVSAADGQTLLGLGAVQASVRFIAAKTGADIQTTKAWDITQGSRNVLAGVIDTGIDYNHPDLVENIWTNPGETGLDEWGNDKRFNGIDDDGNGYVDDWRGWDFYGDVNDPMDDHFHGTHVAGTIGAVGDNGVGVVGVNWRVSLMALKFLNASGSGSFSDAVEAVHYATLMNADLTSNSYGAQPGTGYSEALKGAIDHAHSQGILFVAAAGNSDNDNDVLPVYPASYDVQNVISVAATDSDDRLARFSCYGANTVHLGAPGVNIFSTFPSWQTAAMASGKYPTNYAMISGTSMACPHVAGVAALLKAANPALTGAQIRSMILDGTDPIPALEGKTVTGGRLNAFRALDGVPAGPHPAVWATALDDGTEGEASGNGDGIPNPGERVALAVTLRNMGQEAAPGVSAALSLAEADPDVTLVRAAADFGNVPAGENADAPPFLLYLAPGMTTPRAVRLALTISDSAGHAWTNTLPPLMVYVSYQVGGTVTLDGVPVAGVSVALDGPLPTERLSGHDGAYVTGAIEGFYTATARRDGWLTPNPVQVTVPPSALDVDFAFETATVSGQVTDLFTGAPVADAVVTYGGALSGTVQTDANGLYAIQRVYGRETSLRLVAGKPGHYVDSGPAWVSVPGDATGVNFALSFPDIGVSPQALAVSAEFGQMPRATLLLTNAGMHKLVWTAETGGTLGERRTTFTYGKNAAFFGVADDGEVLWVTNPNHQTLEKRSRTTGAKLGELPIVGGTGHAMGIAWDGKFLWVVDGVNAKLHAVDPENGQVAKTFQAPYIASKPYGIAAGGGYLWTVAFNDRGTVFRICPKSGSEQGHITLSFPVHDIAYFNGALWAAGQKIIQDGDQDLMLSKFNPSDGTLLKETVIPDYFTYDMNMTRGISGNNKDGLWLCSYSTEFGLGDTPGEVTLSLLGTGELNWLRLETASGEIPALGSGPLPMTLNSVAAGLGTHTTTIFLRSNDPAKPVLEVPVSFTVTETQARATLTADNLAPLTNQTFTVAVNLQTAPPFANWGQWLQFDPARLQLVSQTAGSFETFIPDARDLTVINARDEGEVRAGGHALLNNAGGNGTLGLFTFPAVAPGETLISTAPKSAENLFGLALHPAEGGEILPVVGEPLLVTVGTGDPDDPQTPILRLSADNAAPPVGGTFTVTVSIENAPGFRDWGQFLRFDTNRLELVGQAAGEFGGFIADARSVAAGEVRAGGWGLANNAGGNGALGRFTFKALAAGATEIVSENRSPANLFGNILRLDSGSALLPTLAGPLTIEAGGDGNHAPTVTASASPTNGLAPLTVTFTAVGHDQDGDTLSYSWTFGDGATSAQQNPEHTYAAHGDYTATVTVNDGRGGTGQDSVLVRVARENSPPTVSASANKRRGLAPLSVAFTAEGADPDGDPLSYHWVFGDGAESTAQNPSHMYATPGQYTATVTVDDGHGGTAQDTVTIYAWAEVRILEFARGSATNMLMRWTGPEGETYRIESATNLVTGPWRNVAVGVNLSLEDAFAFPVEPGVRAMFYRLRVEDSLIDGDGE